MTKLDHTFGNDGVFWISYKDFLKQFPHINRVRLFNKDWKVAQQWTCVNVPWTVDYLDTKFEITVTERGPLVVVLSQPDQRYFYGLTGRYLFALHFRVYKEGSDTYLFRSMHNSGNGAVVTRSVSAELDDVEPGKYSVIFKVTAVRIVTPTPAEAVNKYAADRKEKLLDVGRKFDYAQTKGNLRAFERKHEKERRDEDREQSKEAHKRCREINLKNRAREKLRKKRIADALYEKRKAAEEKDRERRKKRKAKREERKEQAKKEAIEHQDEDEAAARVDESGSDKGSNTPTSEVPIPTNEEAIKPTETTEVQVTLPAVVQDNVDPLPAPRDVIEVADSSNNLEVATPQLIVPANTPQPPIEALRRDIVEIVIDESLPHHQRPHLRPFTPISNYSSDSELDSPPSPVCSLRDDDFPWDSDM